jgi:hypothetical protein
MLESRTMMSAVAAPILPNLDLPSGAPGAITQLAKPVKNAGTQLGQILNVTIPKLTSITRAADGTITGAVNAVLRLADGTTKTVPATVTLTPDAAPDHCPILNLHLGPIDLNLLGLRVQTSEICLNIEGQQGPGNLLGNLLCGLTGILNGPLDQLLGSLNQLLPLNLGLNINQFTNNGGTLGGTGTLSLGLAGNQTTRQVDLGNTLQEAATACNILNLDLGPVHLNLLGLDVTLDNCDNGPVTVDVTAVPGPGNLLGNLLCGVTHALDGGGIGGQVNAILGKINRLLDRLL